MMATRNARVDLGQSVRGPDVERDFEFTAADFGRIRELIHRRAGISLSDHKRDMAYSRLARRLRACGLDTFKQFSTVSKPTTTTPNGKPSSTR